MDFEINYSSNIEYYRNIRGLTKKELYELAGISKSSFIDMMNRNTFSTTTLEKLAKALNIEVADLVKDRSRDEKKEQIEDFEKIKERLREYEDKHLK